MNSKTPPNFRDPNTCSTCKHGVWDYETEEMYCVISIIRLLVCTQNVCDDYEPRPDKGDVG